MVKINLIEFIKKKVDLKLFIRFVKARAFMYVYVFATGFIIIDMLHFKYWQYSLVFAPLNLIINFFVYKKAFTTKINGG